MGLSEHNRLRAVEAAKQKALEQSKFLDDVVVEPTSPAKSGEVSTLPQEVIKPEIKEEVTEVVKPKRKRK